MSTTNAVEELLNTFPPDHPEAIKVASRMAELNRLDHDQAANLAKIKTLLKQLDTLLGRSTLTQAAGLKEWLADYRTHLADVDRDIWRRFGKELEIGLQKLGLTLGGQYPLLQAGVFSFKMLAETSKVEIWFGPEQELLETAPLSAAEVCKYVERQRKQLGSNLKPDQLLEKLERTYQQLRRPEQLEVRLIELLPMMASLLQSAKWHQNPIRENYRSYSRADFSYDLARCGRDQALRGRLQLKVATRSNTRNRNDFLWIPNETSAGGTTYSHLTITTKE